MAVPQTPFTDTGAEQVPEGVPPFKPKQSHFQTPDNTAPVVVPDAHKFVVGAVREPTPLAVPQTPLTIRVAEQLTIFEAPPEFVPVHVQVLVALVDVGNTGLVGAAVPAEQIV